MPQREKPPERIGRYEIRGELGRGMMGVVYDAFDPSLGRHVALKVIHPTLATSDEEHARFERRFLTEARIAARLLHPGIVVTHDVDRDPATGTLFLAMERIQGRTLTEIIASDERPSWREALRIVARVAAALHHAHEQGVVHRDIKPANVMVLPDGGVKVMDFGLAKIVEGNPEASAAGQWVGTPAFMSPEQIRGERIDARADIFSLGAVAYTLVTGQRPFVSDSVPRLLEKITNEDPEAPSRRIKGVPMALDAVLGRAMAREVDERYETACAFGDDLEDVAAGRAPRHLRAQREAWDEVSQQRPSVAPSALVDLPLRFPQGDPLGKSNDAELPGATTGEARASRTPSSALLYLALGMLFAGGSAVTLALVSPRTLARLVHLVPRLPRPESPSSRAPATLDQGALPGRMRIEAVDLPEGSQLRIAIDGETRAKVDPLRSGAIAELSLPAGRREVFAELRTNGALQAGRLSVDLRAGEECAVEVSVRSGELALRRR